MEQLLKAMERTQESMESMDKKFRELEEGHKKLSGRIEALESNQRSHAGSTGPHEEKSGERDATEVGGLTPPEQQSRLAASSSHEPLRFFKMEQPPPPSQPLPLTYRHSQPFSAPEPFLAGRQYQPVPSTVGEQAYRPLPIAGTRGMSSAGDPITMPWKLNHRCSMVIPLSSDHSARRRPRLPTIVDLAMYSKATMKSLLLMELSRTRRSDHSVSSTLKLRDIARLTSCSDQLSVQKKTEASCCERIHPPRLGETWSHGTSLSPSQLHRLSMAVSSHTL